MAFSSSLRIIRVVALLLGLAAFAGQAAAQITLENTYWKLTRLGDKDATEYRWAREPHFILRQDNRRVSGSGGCNRFTGSYELDGEKLTFGYLAGTMMACQESMEAEKEFLATLAQMRKARVRGRQLQLLDAQDKQIARFEARAMKEQGKSP